MRTKLNIARWLREYGPAVVLVALILLNIGITRNFVKIGTLWNIVLQSFPVIMIAMGMTLVIATGGIDISVGATMAFSSIVFAKLLFQAQTSFMFALTAALAAALAFGVFNGVMVSVFNIQPIIVTLILSIAGRGIAQQVNNGAVLSFYGNAYTDMGVYRLFGAIPIQVIIILLTVAVMVFVINNTVFGTYVQAIGDNRSASHLAGINTVGTLIAVYAITALLTGSASVMETLRLCSADPNNIGNSIELDCIAAVAVGGTSMAGGKAKIVGTLIGAFIMQIITTMVNMNNIQYEYSLVVKSAIIIVALYLQGHEKK